MTASATAPAFRPTRQAHERRKPARHTAYGIRHTAYGRQTGKQANRQTGIVHTPDVVCALRIAYCVLRIAYCVLRVAGCTCILRIVRMRTERRARKKPSPQAAPTHSSPCALPHELPYRPPCSHACKRAQAAKARSVARRALRVGVCLACTQQRRMRGHAMSLPASRSHTVHARTPLQAERQADRCHRQRLPASRTLAQPTRHCCLQGRAAPMHMACAILPVALTGQAHLPAQDGFCATHFLHGPYDMCPARAARQGFSCLPEPGARKRVHPLPGTPQKRLALHARSAITLLLPRCACGQPCTPLCWQQGIIFSPGTRCLRSAWPFSINPCICIDTPPCVSHPFLLFSKPLHW